MDGFYVKVRTANSAFGEGDSSLKALELSRILRNLADRVSEGTMSGVLRDSNGAPVAQFGEED